jgi:ABC-2 type transport system ATP-binding protein
MLLALALAPGAQARDAFVTSFDGTKINTHFYPGEGLAPGERTPTILVGPGWSASGETQSEGAAGVQGMFGLTAISTFIDHGYNVLTWDPRGFGQSGGTVEIDDPKYEGRDVSALIDYVAKQPEAQLDQRCRRVRRHGHRRRACRTKAGDPRVGMSGGSYGGGIQLVAAAIDHRIDAIAPTIAWHSLLTSLFPEGSIKLGWGSLLIGLGIEGATIPGGLSDPASAPGRQDQHFYDTLTEGVTTGKVSQENLDWYASKGPGDLVDRIKAPTLLIQGTVDTLFPLDEAVTNYESIRDNRRKVVRRGLALRRHGHAVRREVPTKMIWFCGGHGACFTGNGPDGYTDQRQLAWFDRYLREKKDVDTGPRFAWIADDGQLRSSSGYPLTQTGKLRGHGSGTLPIVPGQGSGGLIFATQAPVAVNVSIPGPDEDANALGAPRVELSYKGTGAPQGTFVYAQIVNPRSHQVVGNMATPIPIVLDGKQHSISRRLEMIAARAPAGGGYTLQLTPSSTLWDIQRSVGSVNFSNIDVALPLADPVTK